MDREIFAHSRVFVEYEDGTEQAIQAAFEDMYADTKMIQERRKMRQMEHKKH